VRGNRYLCVQRGSSKYIYISEKFEFPGGKVEPGESNEDALIREIREELNANIKVMGFLIKVQHQYPDFHVEMDGYLCELVSAEVRLSEHKSLAWLPAGELGSLDWAAADLPIVEKLQNL